MNRQSDDNAVRENQNDDNAVSENENDDNVVPENENDDNVVPENHNGLTEQYRIRARGEYKIEFEELRRRCKRAALMNYNIAAKNDKNAFYFQAVAFTLGTSGMWLIKETLYNINNTYGNWVNTVAALAFIGSFAYAASRILWKFYNYASGRAKDHVTAAADWQLLELKLRSYKIQLNNPSIPAEEYAIWWNDIVEKRRKLCLAYIPKDVYDNTPAVH